MDRYSLWFYGGSMGGLDRMVREHGVIKGGGSMNYEWLGGLFAAEGCVHHEHHTCKLSIAQSNPQFLKELQEFIGYGSFNGKQYFCYGVNAFDLAVRIRKYSLHKKVDLDRLVQRYIDMQN